MTKLSKILALSRQGLLPLFGEIFLRLFGVNLRSLYNAKFQNKYRLIGQDPDTLDYVSFENLLSRLYPRLKEICCVDDFLHDEDMAPWFSLAESSRLGELLERNGSDKSTSNDYYLLYQPVISSLLAHGSHFNLAEIGLGTNNLDTLSNMGANGVPGASVRSFRDYNENISVFGADVDKRILFQEDRIHTLYVDQMRPETIDDLIRLSQPDLLIDDGLHAFRSNLNVLNSFLAYSRDKPNKWLFIEDVRFAVAEQVRCWQLVLAALESDLGLKTWLVRSKSAFVVIVRS